MADAGRAPAPHVDAMHALSVMGFSGYLVWELLGLFRSLPFLVAGFEDVELLFMRASSFFVLAIGFVVAVRAAQRIAEHMRALFWFAVATTSIVMVGGAAEALWGLLPVAVVYVLWCMYALSLTSLMILWSFHFYRSFDGAVPAVITAAYVIGFVAFLLLSLLVSSADLMAYLLVGLVSASTSLGVIAFLFRTHDAGDEDARLVKGNGLHESDERGKASLWSLPRFLHAVTYGVSYGFAIALLQTLGPLSACVGIASGFLGSLIALFLLKRGILGMGRDIRRTTFIPVIIGLLLFALHPPLTYVLCGIPIIGASIVTAIIGWVGVAREASTMHIVPIRLFCATKFPGWLGFFLGTMISIVVVVAPQQVAAMAIAVLACLACVLFAIVELCTYAGTEGVQKESVRPLEEQESYQEPGFFSRGEALAQDKGLSEREKDVFRLLAKGRNAEFISHELCIARPTAKTHIQHIYQKLCINSQQELIDLVESYPAERHPS